MICLTGDVHHMSLQINDQKHIPEPGLTETQVARRYVELLEKYGVKATLYICGRVFTEEWEDVAAIAEHELVEVGGHMFNARFPRECFDAYGEQTGEWNGPRWYQDWDIARMVGILRDRTGLEIVSWRGHSYMVDRNSHELLAKHGIRLVSDDVEKANRWPFRIAHGLVSHPMNVIPDHDHLLHAHRTEEYVARANQANYGADDFGAVSYRVEDWGCLVRAQVEAIEAQGGLATLIVHPLCHYLADGFRTFEALLATFATRRTVFAREILGLVDSPPPGLVVQPRERAPRYGPMGRHLAARGQQPRPG